MIEQMIMEIYKDKASVIKFIADNTLLREGIYLKVDIDKPFDESSFVDYIGVPSKVRSSSDYVYSSRLATRGALMEYIATRDLLSKILNDDANKTIDGSRKKALSTVFMALAYGNKFSPLNEESNEKNKFDSVEDLSLYMSDNFFGNFATIGEKIRTAFDLEKMNIRNMEIENAIEMSLDDNRFREIMFCNDYWKTNLCSILKFVKERNVSVKGVVKIFFYSSSGNLDDSVGRYEQEYSYYLTKYIFNKGSIENIGGVLKGGISYGFNNHDGKPLLKPRRMNVNNVKLHTLKEALDTKLVFDLLKVVSDSNGASLFGFNGSLDGSILSDSMEDLSNLRSGNKGMLYRLHYKDKYIEDYDLRAEYVSVADMNIHKRLVCKDYMSGLENKPFFLNDNIKVNSYIGDLLAFLVSTSPKYLNKYTKEYCFQASFFDEPGVLMYERMVGEIFKKYQYMIHTFLHNKKVSDKVKNDVAKNFTKECVLAFGKTMYVSKFYRNKLKELFNVRLNVVREFCGECGGLDMFSAISSRLEKVVEKNTGLEINSDAEFYFVLGQVAYYIESLSRGDIDYGIFRFYTDKRKVSVLKSYMIGRFNMYSFNVGLKSRVFKEIYLKVLAYTPNSSINSNLEYFYMGLCADNIFYKSLKRNRKVIDENEK